MTRLGAKFCKRGIDSEIPSLEQHKTSQLFALPVAQGTEVPATEEGVFEKLEVDKDGAVRSFTEGRNVARGFMMAGAAVSWCSRKQSITYTSSREAECIAIPTACQETV